MKKCITFFCGLNLHLTAFILATVATFCLVSVLVLLDFLMQLFFLLSYTRVSSSPFIFPQIPCCGCLLVLMLPCVGVLCTLLQALSHSKNEKIQPPTTIQKHTALSRTKDDGIVYSRAVSRTPMMFLCGAEGANWDVDVPCDGVFCFVAFQLAA